MKQTMRITDADIIKIVDFNMCPICDGVLHTKSKEVKECKTCCLKVIIDNNNTNANGLPFVTVKRPNPAKKRRIEESKKNRVPAYRAMF